MDVSKTNWQGATLVTPETLNITIHLLAYDDHADGNCYFAEECEVSLPDSFNTALTLLTRHDTVCIVDSEAYYTHNHNYYTIAPYAIIISAGIYAQPTSDCK